MSGRAREFLRLLWIVPPALTFTGLVGTINVVTGSSMQPAINPEGPHQRDVVWVDRWSILAKRRYRRGDVVSLRQVAHISITLYMSQSIHKQVPSRS